MHCDVATFMTSNCEQTLASCQLKPEIDKVFAFDEMAEAHRYMESNAQIGKILVKVWLF